MSRRTARDLPRRAKRVDHTCPHRAQPLRHLFGLNYISTVPPTSMLTAELFGRWSVGLLFGWIFFAYQIGAALAAYVGGLVYDLTGTYDWAFISAGILGVTAAGMVLAIPEPQRRVPRRA